MTCDCIDNINEKLHPQNLKLSLSYVLEGPRAGMYPTMATQYIDKPKRAPQPPVLFPTFCPFCGARYKENGNG